MVNEREIYIDLKEFQMNMTFKFCVLLFSTHKFVVTMFFSQRKFYLINVFKLKESVNALLLSVIQLFSDANL